MVVFESQWNELVTALTENLFSTVMLTATLGMLITVNILLGGIVAYKGEEFDAKTFFFGFAKGILILLCGIVFCEILDVIPVLASMIGVEVPSEMMTFGEVVGILYIAIKKYVKAIIEKFENVIGFTDDEKKEAEKVIPSTIAEQNGE